MKMPRHEFLAGAAALSLAGPAAVLASSGQGLDARQRAAVERVLRGFANDGIVPGVSCSIGNASDTLGEFAFGLRSVTPPAPMLPATRCALASVSKQFAAAGVLWLAQKGALALDAPLSNYLPRYLHAREMTLSQILTMRSGISADDEACEKSIGGRIDAETLLANLNDHKLDYPPGTQYAYSNCAYDVAGIVIERVSGIPYGRFVAQTFFDPLGMTSSHQLGARSDSNFAQGYVPKGHGWRTEPASEADRVFASGNLVSTVGDMQRWNRSLLNATLLSRQALDQMFKVPTLVGRSHTHYASGWFVEPSGVIWHGGTLAGYATVNMLVPSTNHAIVILSNTGPSDRWKPQEVARELYNEAQLGPTLPPLLPRVRSTLPQST